jgi:hypothetical protein
VKDEAWEMVRFPLPYSSSGRRSLDHRSSGTE